MNAEESKGSTYWLLATGYGERMYFGDATPSSRGSKRKLEPLRDEHATYHPEKAGRCAGDVRN